MEIRRSYDRLISTIWFPILMSSSYWIGALIFFLMNKYYSKESMLHPRCGSTKFAETIRGGGGGGGGEGDVVGCVCGGGGGGGGAITADKQLQGYTHPCRLWSRWMWYAERPIRYSRRNSDDRNISKWKNSKSVTRQSATFSCHGEYVI